MSTLLNEALAALQQKRGGWSVIAASAAQLTDRIEQVARGPDASYEVLRPILKLIAVLESAPNSKDAAQGLIQILQRSPSAYKILSSARSGAASRGRKTQERFTAFEGRALQPTAPTYDSPAPKGSLPGWRLARPLDPIAEKARRR